MQETDNSSMLDPFDSVSAGDSAHPYGLFDVMSYTLGAFDPSELKFTGSICETSDMATLTEMLKLINAANLRQTSRPCRKR